MEVVLQQKGTRWGTSVVPLPPASSWIKRGGRWENISGCSVRKNPKQKPNTQTQSKITQILGQEKITLWTNAATFRSSFIKHKSLFKHKIHWFSPFGLQFQFLFESTTLMLKLMEIQTSCKQPALHRTKWSSGLHMSLLCVRSPIPIYAHLVSTNSFAMVTANIMLLTKDTTNNSLIFRK